MMNVDYDKDADVLYISFGLPRPGIGKEVDPGDVVMLDPLLDKPVGLTIIGFRERYIEPIIVKMKE